MYEFTTDCLTGIEQIDNEHRELFTLINQSIKMVSETDDINAIAKNLIAKLKDYASNHFKHEEEYMEKIGYSGLEAQKVAHQAFVDRLNEVNLEAVDGDQEGYLHELIEFLLGWLANHILKMDKKIPMEG